MKRFTSALAALVFPLSFAFALTARPAVLYAESSTQGECASVTSTSCAGKSAGAACTTDDGKAGTCTATRCASPDGGSGTGLVCLERPTTTPTPGKTIPDPPAETTPGGTSESDDGGCSLATARSSTTVPALAFAGLAFAGLAFARRARRTARPSSRA